MAEHFRYQVAVRDRRWKLIHVPDAIDRLFTRGAEFELYDLARDPGESENVLAANPDAGRRLHQVLMNWSRTSRGMTRTPNTRPSKLDPERERQLRALGYIH